jgi:hypothetical protein
MIVAGSHEKINNARNKTLLASLLIEQLLLSSKEYSNFFILFLLHLHTRGGGRIRTNDLHFMRRDLQPIELPLWDKEYSKLEEQNTIDKIKPQIKLPLNNLQVLILIKLVKKI